MNNPYTGPSMGEPKRGTCKHGISARKCNLCAETLRGYSPLADIDPNESGGGYIG